jgi:drug/metabolite transporter (DMT)-like permease
MDRVYANKASEKEYSMIQPFILGMVSSAFAYGCFTGADTVTKYLAEDYSVFQIMAGQYLLAALLFFGVTLVHKGGQARALFRMQRPGLHIKRIFVHMAAQSLVFLAVPHMQLSEFYIVLFTSPVFVALFAPLLLGEKSSRALWLVILCCFIGTFIALRPEGLTLWAGLAFLGAVLFAYALILLRRMAATETAEMTVLMLCLGLGLLSLIPAAVAYRPMPLEHLWILLLGGVLFTCAQLGQVMAFRLAPANLAAVPQFLQLVYGIIAGYLVFGHQPDMYVYAGGLLVIGANLWLIRMQGRASAITSSRP